MTVSQWLQYLHNVCPPDRRLRHRFKRLNESQDRFKTESSMLSEFDRGHGWLTVAISMGPPTRASFESFRQPLQPSDKGRIDPVPGPSRLCGQLSRLARKVSKAFDHLRDINKFGRTVNSARGVGPCHTRSDVAARNYFTFVLAAALANLRCSKCHSFCDSTWKSTISDQISQALFCFF